LISCSSLTLPFFPAAAVEFEAVEFEAVETAAAVLFDAAPLPPLIQVSLNPRSLGVHGSPWLSFLSHSTRPPLQRLFHLLFHVSFEVSFSFVTLTSSLALLWLTSVYLSNIWQTISEALYVGRGILPTGYGARASTPFSIGRARPETKVAETAINAKMDPKFFMMMR
jgi:hypothetical protein